MQPRPIASFASARLLSTLPALLALGLSAAWRHTPTHALSPPAPAAVAAPPSAAPAVAPTLAQPYHAGVDLSAYWVSEKYDGVRGLWTGEQLLSRQGLPIRAPAWFTAGWPRTPMDGELWAGRGQFAHAQSTTAQTQPSDAAWQRMRWMVFDAPAQPGPFSQRSAALDALITHLNLPWVQRAPQWRVASHAALMAQLQQYDKAGAEGLMLRREDAPYRGGRSDDLLKLKTFDDAEAVVIAHLPGKGPRAELTGALRVQTADGRRFDLGSGLSDAQRRTPPPLGTVVTYRYNGLHASGLPRFARLWRVRIDMAAPTTGQTPRPAPPGAAR